MVEFLWGSKKDERSASVTVDGKTTVVTKGGYNGFQWLPVPVTSTSKPKTKIKLHRGGHGAMAFIAGVRVREKGAGAEETLPGGEVEEDHDHPAERTGFGRSLPGKAAFLG